MPAASPIKTYPTHGDYASVVKNLATFIKDPVLKSGIVKMRTSKALQEPLSYPGGFAVVYPVQVSMTRYALRCWTANPGDSETHYLTVANHLKAQRLGCMIDLHYEREGILVKGVWYPTLRMDWVEGESLQEFMEKNRANGSLVRQAATAFRGAMAELKKARVAHGDLQGENLKVVTENGKPVVRFIDYDTMFVPGLDGKAVANVGHPAYQHPQRGRSTTLNHYDDHFGALVIYVSLLALAEDPGLWADVHTAGALDKELIFAKEDFAANSPSRLFHRLSKLSPTVRLLTIALWNFSRQSGIDRLPSLEDIVSQAEKQIAPPPPNPAAGATSNFDNLLKTLSSGATPSGGAVPSGAWFDDRDFRGAPPAAVAPPIPHTVRPGTPAWMINPSSRTAPTAPATSPTPGSFASMMAQAQSRVAHPVPVTPPGQITNASPPGAPVPVSPSNPTTLGEKIGAALVYCVVIYILLNILHACTH